ncbi:Guanylate cyclase activator 2B [Oryzias melastigma]|uniref:Guanylate cyclase activator 2B n=1 Tax=Oryzias melastigma TaxID=30732 RepID=A0A834KZH7_ORYME|nr:Guanylate cyclase activator 2B [Oryzias melastigma]
MRRLRVALVLLLLSVCRGALSVHVQVEDQVFPLEAVKQLKALLDSNAFHPRLANARAAAVCEHPLLPQVFHPACQEEGADVIFTKLMSIAFAGLSKRFSRDLKLTSTLSFSKSPPKRRPRLPGPSPRPHSLSRLGSSPELWTEVTLKNLVDMKVLDLTVD